MAEVSREGVAAFQRGCRQFPCSRSNGAMAGGAVMDAFQRIASGQPASLLEASLVFAQDEYPELDVAAFVEQVENMAEGFEIFLAGESSDRGVLQLLNHFLFQELGFTGNTCSYYDPRNSYLNEVITRRTGIPISLSVLYQSLAGSAGVPLTGVNLPGHFLLAYTNCAGQRLYVDVFHGGQWLDWSECQDRLRQTLGFEESFAEHDFPPMGDHEVLARMLRNLKGIYSRSDLPRCLRVQQRLVQLLPNQPSELRDLGILYYHTGKPILAARVLEDLIKRHPQCGEDELVGDYLAKAIHDSTLVN